MQSNRLTELFSKSDSSAGYYGNYCHYITKLMESLDYNAVSEVSKCFLSARERGSTIFFVGNGGSAATASHFAQDLAEVGRKAKVKSFKTLSLTDNVPYITAVGNDYGYDKVFSMQLKELFNPGDVLVAISASGNSPNVIEAANLAKEKDGPTVGIVGFDGGRLGELCDYIVHAVSNKGEYGPVEDIHMILDHMITSHLTFALQNGKG